MICFFGGRADLWPPLQNAVDRLSPRPPELLAILSKTFSDPARFLSPRTVSTHLHQVFPKLGITSRAALRDALADTSPE